MDCTACYDTFIPPVKMVLFIFPIHQFMTKQLKNDTSASDVCGVVLTGIVLHAYICLTKMVNKVGNVPNRLIDYCFTNCFVESLMPLSDDELLWMSYCFGRLTEYIWVVDCWSGKKRKF